MSDIGREQNIRMNSIYLLDCGLFAFLIFGPVDGRCEYDKETLVSLKEGEFLNG
jgi:hypothetical protein